MDKYLYNNSATTITISSIGIVLEPTNSWTIPYEINHILIENNEIIQLIRDSSILVGTEGSEITDPTEGEVFFRTLIGEQAFVAIPEESIPWRFVNTTAVDPMTGCKSVSLFMNMMTLLRALYNAESLPIYVEDFVPILGSTGWAEQHAAGIDDLNNIHTKLGCHTQEILSYARQRPLDLLIYYGYMNSFNSAQNSLNNELVAQDMAKYSLIVLGQGFADPAHPDYANSCIIINRIKVLNPLTMIFGYLSMTLEISSSTSTIAAWDTMGIHGIFLDEAGYNYGTLLTNGRAAQNEKIDLIHSKESANICFINSWNMDHIIGTVNDPSFPNTTWNPDEVESKLTQDDWYLLESFAINTTAYTSTNGYAPYEDWASRGVKAQSHRINYGINLASVGINDDSGGTPQELSDFAFVSAMAWSLEANGTSSVSYGASTTQVGFYSKPEIHNMGRWWNLNASIQQHGTMAYRYVDHGRFVLNFDNGNQLGQVQKY